MWFAVGFRGVARVEGCAPRAPVPPKIAKQHDGQNKAFMDAEAIATAAAAEGYKIATTHSAERTAAAVEKVRAEALAAAKVDQERADAEGVRKLAEADRRRQEAADQLKEEKDKAERQRQEAADQRREQKDREAALAKANEAATSELERKLLVVTEARRVAEIQAARAGAEAKAELAEADAGRARAEMDSKTAEARRQGATEANHAAEAQKADGYKMMLGFAKDAGAGEGALCPSPVQ